MKKPLMLLVDGNALIHRAYHALPPMSTRTGLPTNAVYGFLTIFFKAINELKPDCIAVCWDVAGKTFRHVEYEEYKGKRIRQADELYIQIDYVKEFLPVLGVASFECPGYEADDLIGTIAEKTAAEGIKVMILTGDLDALQLVGENINVYTMRKGIGEGMIYDDKAVGERYGGLRPEQLIDYKALRGDPSDNIPGVQGIGEKGAIELIKEYGSVDKLIEDLPLLPAKYEKLLRGKEEELKKSRMLVTIVRDVPIEYDVSSTRLQPHTREEISDIFHKYEIQSLLSRLPSFVPQERQSALFEPNSEASEKKGKNDLYHLVTPENAEQFLKDLGSQEFIAVDTETEDLNGPIIGLSFSWTTGEAYYVPLRHNNGVTLGLDFLEKVKPILEDNKIAKCGHNLKYDYQVLKRCGINLTPLSFDSMIASYLLNPHAPAHGLDRTAFVELAYEKIPITQVIGEKKKDSMADAPLDLVCQYSSEDADITLRLVRKFQEAFGREKALEKLFYSIEMPLVEILADMELEGIKLDTDFLAKLSKGIHQKIDRISQEIYELAGSEFNINSTQQMKQILFVELGIESKALKKGKTGISVAASELLKLKGQHPIIDLILEYRELNKLSNTYVDALPQLVDQNGCVHTSFNQTSTTTGRLSSTDPNLQNIPVRTTLGKEIRKAFIADQGAKLVSLDYSQIELRIVATLANDKRMLDAFKNNQDIHTRTASELNGVSSNQVTSEMRRDAKTVNFGIIYGQGAHGLSEQTGMSHSEAAQYIEKYFSLHAQIKEYFAKVLAEAREAGYTETLFGRRRYLPDINSGIAQVRLGAERMAINMPVQGTAADIMKMAMIEVRKKIRGTQVKMLLTVHDELVFEIPEGQVAKWVPVIKETMEGVFDLEAGLVVEAKVGDNWGEMTPFNL